MDQFGINIERDIQNVQKFSELAVTYLVKYGFQALYGLIILLVGLKIAAWCARLCTNLCQKKHFDVTLTKFLAGIVRILVVMFTVLVTLDKFGITISPLIATISAMIFGASFALQAPLSNYAAGLTIIFTRPFAVGDTISVKGYSGVVDDIKLPATVLSTGDGEKVTIPNKDIVGEVITNSKEKKVADLVVGIGYSDDPEKAIALIKETLKSFPEIISEPASQVGIQSFGDSSVNIGIRYFSPTTTHLKTVHAANLAIFRALQRAKISIPFPQREIRILSEGPKA